MLKRLLLCFTLLLAVVGAKADDAYWTLTFPADTQESSNSYTATWTASMTAGGAWSISAFNNYQNTWTSIRAGWKTAATTATIATTSACEPAIGEIVVTVETLSSTSSVTSAYLQVASDADFSNIVETVTIDDATITAGAGDWTYTITTPTENAYYKLVYELAKCSSNGILRISQVAYYEAEASGDDDDDEEDDAEPGVIYLLGASNDWTMAATNVNLTETEAGSKVYYNEAVTFTAGDYIAIYTQIDTSWGKDYRYAGYSSGEAISLNTETKLYNNAELGWETSFYISTAGTYAVTVDMSDSTNMTILIYDDSYTIPLPNNLYFFGNDGVWSTTAHAGELAETSEGIWEGEMTVTSGYFTLIDTISETSDDWTTINAHRYYPAGDKAITLGDSSSMGYGADGSWTIDNGTYDVVVNCNTLKLIVTAQSEEEETTVDTLTVAEAIAIIEAGSYTSDSVYVKGIVSQIDSVYYTYYGNANYYISDDGATDSQFYIYRGLGLNGASFTSADDLWVGDTLILYGVLTTYNSTPEMAAKNYIVYQGKVDRTTEEEEDEEEEEETTVDTLTVAEALALIEASENTSDSVYVKGIVSQIDSVYYTYYGNANYYISDDGTTDSQFYIYRGLGLNGASFTSADDLLVGDTLIVYGVLTSYYSTPEMAAKNYIVYQGRPESTDDDDEEEEDTTTYDVYVKTSEITSGQSYLIVVQDGTNTLYATNHSASYTYGYLYTNTVSGLVDTISVDASGYNAFVITASETTDGAYTIQDSYGRYLYQSGTYKSFNLSSTNNGYDWTIVANEDGTWTITYASSSYWMQYSTSYSSFGVYSSEQSGALMPYLYELVSSDEESDGDDTGDGDEDGDDTGDTDDSSEYVYTLVTDASTLAEGDVVTIVNETYSVVIGENNSTYFGYSSATIVDNTIAASEVVTPITLEAVDGGYWKLQLSDGSYLYAVSTSSNQLGATTETLTDSSDIATISIAQDESTSSYDATILFQKSESDRTLIQYNNGTYGRFSCYKSDGSSNQNPVQLYRRTEGTMPEVIDTLSVAEAIALIEASENTSDSVYVKGIVSQIDSVYYTYYGNANYYISDDGTTDSQFYIYRGLGLNGASFTSADDLLVGDTLIVYGVLTSYYSTPEMAAKNYIVYQGRPESTGDDDEEEDTTTYDVYAKTSEITSGQSYLIVVQDGTNTLYATNHSASYTYGYLYTNTVSGLVDTISVDASGYNAFVITASETTDGAYTIQDSYGRYLYQSSTYKSFNLSSTNDSYDWTIVANEDGTWTITYASSSYWMQYSTSYSSFGVYSSEQDGALMPYLYELVSSDEEGDGDDTGDGDEDGDDTGDDDEEDTTEIVAYYTLVTDADDLSDGDTITIVNEQYSVAISALASNGNYFTETAVTIAGDTLAATADVTPLILSATDDGNWLLTLEDGTYMAAIGTGSSNYLGVLEEANDTSAVASIDIALDEDEVYYSATILFQSTSNRNLLQYNHTNTRFSCYKSDGSSTQYPVQIYSKVTTSDGTATAISSVESESATLRQGVYTLTGVKLNSADNLPAGIYIVDGQKVLVK